MVTDNYKVGCDVKKRRNFWKNYVHCFSLVSTCEMMKCQLWFLSAVVCNGVRGGVQMMFILSWNMDMIQVSIVLLCTFP
jgi:hypothetical protein